MDDGLPGWRPADGSGRFPSRFEAPAPEEPPGRPPTPWRPLLAGALSLLLVGVLIGVSYVTWFRPSAADPDVTVKASQQATQEMRSATPHEIVTAYFDALAQGDIERALAMGELGGTGSEALVTPAAYAVTRQLSPLSDLHIHTEDPAATELEVSYTLGDQRIDTSVRTVRLDTGEYRMARTTVPVQIQVPGGDNVPLLVNGQSVPQNRTFELVPGRYQLATGLQLIAYPEASAFTINSLARADETVLTVSPQLTEVGRDALLAAAKASLRRCINSHQVAPEGCPNRMQVNRPVVASSIAWELIGDPWRSGTPTLDPADQSVAVLTVRVRARLSVDYTDGSSSPGQEIDTAVQVRASMLADDPASVIVTWDA